MPEDHNTDPTTTEPTKISFSIPQIIGGAGAAATAAAIGSQLGVAGTVIGAAIASVIGGVAGTLYSAGLAGTHRKVSQVIQRTTGSEDPSADQVAEEVATDEGMPESPTMVQADLGLIASSAESELEPDPKPNPDRRKLIERMVLSGAAIFVVAVGIITTLELGLGRSLDGSSHTTVQQITQDRGGVNRPIPPPVASESVEPSVAPKTPVPTVRPTATRGPTPSPIIPTSSTDIPVPATPRPT